MSDRDLKLLWARGGGRCAICNCELAPQLEASGGVVVGEMAHVIARSSEGPRGEYPIEEGKKDSYENLVLLCPTHHTTVDKAKKDYPPEMLLAIKQEHESRVLEALSALPFQGRDELFSFLSRLFAENGAVLGQMVQTLKSLGQIR